MSAGTCDGTPPRTPTVNPAAASPAAGGWLAGVVVPAHNEEAVIGRCLAALTRGVPPGALQVVVVCNGCTDATAEIARAAGVEVLQTPVAGKAGALNLGDAALSAFPRFYVDADIEVTGQALASVAEVLRGGDCLAAAPAMTVDVAATSRAVRAYHRVWTRLPYVAAGHVGSGVVGLSEAGRARFGEFPAAIADDYFLYSLFTPEERRTIREAVFTVFPARTTRDLVRRKTRVFAGNIEMSRRGHGTGRANGPAGAGLRGLLATDPRLAFDLPAYVGITVTAKLLARRKIARGDLGTWERDDSSRVPTGSATGPAGSEATRVG